MTINNNLRQYSIKEDKSTFTATEINFSSVFLKKAIYTDQLYLIIK